LAGGRGVTSIDNQDENIRALAFNRTSEWLGYIGNSGFVTRVNFLGSSGTLGQAAEALCWSGDDLLYLSSVLDPHIGRVKADMTMHGHDIPISGDAKAFAFSDNGEFFAVAVEGTAQVWKSLPPRRVFSVPMPNVRRLAVNNDGSRLAIGLDRAVVLWPVGESEPLVRFPPHEKQERSNLQILSFASHGQRLISKWDDRALRSWDAETGQLLPLLETPSQVTDVVVSPTGRYVAFATSQGEILCWDSFDVDDNDYRRFLMSK
jgi:hypothetical protein